jgi:hypothetical protein
MDRNCIRIGIQKLKCTFASDHLGIDDLWPTTIQMHDFYEYRISDLQMRQFYNESRSFWCGPNELFVKINFGSTEIDLIGSKWILHIDILALELASYCEINRLRKGLN